MSLTSSKRRLFAAAAMLAWLPMAAALAQEPAESEAELDRAPVAVDGRVLLYVRGVRNESPRERATAIAGRIINAAADPAFEPDQLRVLESPNLTRILAGEQLLMNVFEVDAELGQIDRHALADFYLQAIRKAVITYREQREPEHIRRGLLMVLAATAGLIAILGLLFWLNRRLSAVLNQKLKHKVQALRIQSLELIPGGQMWSLMKSLAYALRIALVALVLYVYAQVSLSQFPQTRPIADRLAAYLIEPLTTMGQSFVDELPSLLFLLVLYFVVRLVLRALHLYFAAIGNGRVRLANFAAEWAVPTYRLVRLGVIAIALIVAYPYIPGSDSEAFKGLSIFVGVLLSIGSSSFIANSIAGYALIYRRLFAAGDRVRIGDSVGEVLEMRMQVTRLRTNKNEEVIVPNSTILNSVVTNYSALAANRGLILHTTVGIGYGTPWRQVDGMLLMAAKRTPVVLADPPPFVLQKALGDFCVTYELNAYTSSADDMIGKYHALHANILDVFNEYGVQIMTPAYEGDPAEPKVVPKDRWYQEPSLPPPEATSAAKR